MLRGLHEKSNNILHLLFIKVLKSLFKPEEKNAWPIISFLHRKEAEEVENILYCFDFEHLNFSLRNFNSKVNCYIYYAELDNKKKVNLQANDMVGGNMVVLRRIAFYQGQCK